MGLGLGVGLGVQIGPMDAHGDAPRQRQRRPCAPSPFHLFTNILGGSLPQGDGGQTAPLHRPDRAPRRADAPQPTARNTHDPRHRKNHIDRETPVIWTGLLGSLRFTDRLAVRLALLLSVALLPLGILAVLSSLEHRRADLRSAERALISLTADTVAGRRALVESAFTTARTLAGPALERLDDPEACRALMADTVGQAGVFTFAGFTEPDGQMRCASDGRARDFSATPGFRALLSDPRPMVGRVAEPADGDRPVLIVVEPVLQNGTLRGFLSVSIALRSLGWMGQQDDTGAEVRPVLYNRMGDVLTLDEAGFDPAAALPQGVALDDLAGPGAPTVFAGRTEAGERAIFAKAELVPGQLYVLGVWQPDAAPAAILSPGRWPGLFPLMMWVASLAVVYFSLHVLVIRHLRQLNRQMRRFALGDRTLPEPPSAGVSRELREVHATFQKMAALVARDEAELSAALAEKEAGLRERTVLLKEVHHRVKNNLQLIASILNLQMRRLSDPHTRRVLQNVQDRVIGLAAIHRSLYQSDQLSQLRADTLIDELLRHLFAVGTEAGSGIDLTTDLAPVTLEADQLVPLSLLLTEVVTNALKYGEPPAAGGRATVRVALRREGDSVALSVVNSLGAQRAPGAEGEVDDSSGTRLGTELIDAFALQLGAETEQGRTDTPAGPCWQVALRFPLPRPSADTATAPDANPEASPDPAPAADPAPAPQATAG